ASSGLEALKRLLSEEFAVILLDVQMPELDGFETARLIRERNRTHHTPIIFLTAINTDRTHVALGYALGAVDYLFKPLDAEILKAKVASFVELARKTRALEREVRQREHAEEAVRALNLELERRVNQRTVALRTANRELRSEISERKRAEDARESLLLALVGSEEQYRALADAMPQLVWTAVPDGSFDYVNQRWVEYTGLSQDDSEGDGWQAALHPDDLRPTVERWKQSVRTGQVFEIGCRFRRSRDAMHRWHLSRALPQRDADGRICRWLGTCTDIDDQKRIEDSLQFLAEASKLLAQSLEYETSLAQVARLAVPWFADWCAVDLAQGGTLRRLAFTHVDPEREQLGWELWNSRPSDDQADLGSARVFLTGRSELSPEVSDELLAAITGDAGLTRARELGLWSFLAVPVFARGQVIGVFNFITAESHRRYGPGDVEIAEDLARRAGFAVDNARLFHEVEEAGKAKDRFLAMLGHELRNPLAPIRNAVSAMSKRTAPDAALERHRAIIERQAGHLSRLVDDLLDVARVTRGKIELQRQAVDLCRTAEFALEAVLPAAAERKQQLRTRLPRKPVWIDADPTRLEQIITNLLTNAVKYTALHGEISLEIAVEAPAEPGQGGSLASGCPWASIRVRDTGIGMTEEVLASVFEPFSQADSTFDRSQGGLGLGLTVVRHLVELHGGRVSARSEGTGRGSEFEVRLPALPCAPRTAPVAEASPSSEPGAAHARVLVVDDNQDAAETLNDLLTLWGYEVAVAGDGEQALELAGEFHPHAVLMDIGLPGIDGYTVGRRLREREREAVEAPPVRKRRSGVKNAPAAKRPVVLVAVTGYGLSEDRRRSHEAGFDHHLAKPVDPDALRDLLHRELAGLACAQ
ncbi:MAG: tmoS, partial [Armatimonadetes bacterium]|nr:tmoS [Armatimonadota bacterium]